MNIADEAVPTLIADPEARLQRWAMPVFDDTASPARTAQEIDDIEKAAYEEGHQRGLDEGYREGLQLAQQQADRMRSLIEHLARPLAQLDDELEHLLVDLASGIARRILAAELQLDPQRIVDLTRSALAALPEDLREVRLHLHPDDANLVRTLMQPPPPIRQWEIHDDTKLARGDIRVATDLMVLDARLDTRSEQVRAGLQEPGR